MKRLFSLFMLVCIVLSSFSSCARISETAEFEEETEEQTTETPKRKSRKMPEYQLKLTGEHEADGVFAIGFSRQDITPTKSVPLAGYPGYMKRLSKSIKTKIAATCVAIKDTEGAAHLLFTLDTLSFPEDATKSVRNLLSPLTGIPPENITISCTHTHEAPVTGGTTDTLLIEWNKILYNGIKNAAVEAIADLDEAEIYENTIKVPGLTFNRRLITKDGQVRSVGDSKTGTIDYETDPDDSLQVLKFDRKNQPDVVLVNWRAHPCFNSGETATVVSADFIHYMRTFVENKLGVKCAYYQGACGNLITSCLLPPSSPKYVAEANGRDVKEYGECLGENVIKSLENMNKINAGKVKTATMNVEAKVDHSEDGRYQDAVQVNTLIRNSKLSEARKLADKLGFDSIYHANTIVTKYESGETKIIPISALSIGDAAFIFAPYEMFDITGMQIKSASPFKNTFICEQSNGSFSYFPSEECFEKRGYEVCQFKYVKGTSEQLRDGFIALLKSLK